MNIKRLTILANTLDKVVSGKGDKYFNLGDWCIKDEWNQCMCYWLCSTDPII